ncbi:MAG: serine kinase [Pseudomonadota bacterium]
MHGGSEQRHASAVALDGQGCLIFGAPGAGKSTLAIEMMALGATLVADDRVDLIRRGDTVWMAAPQSLAGVVEARGIGLLAVDAATEAPVSLIVDLDKTQPQRLPEKRTCDLLGLAHPVIFGQGASGLAAKLVLALGGTILDPDAPIKR